MRKLLAVVVAPVVAFASGCGGVAIEDAPAEMATAMCPVWFDCLGPAAQLFFQDEATCETELAKEFADGEIAALQEGIERGTASYDEGAMADCVSEVSSRGCGFENDPLPEVCEQAMQGLVEAGGACDFDVECAGDAFCFTENVCPGACTLVAKEGESCAETLCENGTECRGDTCVALATVDQACGGDSDATCEFGLICVGDDSDTGAAGTCKDLDSLMTAAGGEACDNSEGPFCQEGLYCVVTELGATGYSTTCQAEAASGGDCNAGFPDNCPAGEYCDADLFGGFVEGTCRTLPAAGEPCADALFADCAAGLGCDDQDVCRPKLRIDDACTQENEDLCYSGFCGESVCAVEPDC